MSTIYFNLSAVANSSQSSDSSPVVVRSPCASASSTPFFVSTVTLNQQAPLANLSASALAHLLRLERMLALQQTDKFGADHIDLAVFWQCDFPVLMADADQSSPRTQRRFGVHHLLRLPFRSTTAPGACPLKLTVHCPQDASHTFGASGSGVLEVPVVVRVRNASERQPASFVFETLPTDEEFDSSSRSFRVRTASGLGGGRYFWKGATRQRVHQLLPGHSTHLKLTAVFTAPGTYNVNRCVIPGLNL